MSQLKTIFRNQLLSSLSPDDLARLSPHLEKVALHREDVLVASDIPIDHAYFIEQGMASTVTATPTVLGVEASCIGPEGMTGIPLLFELDRTPLTTIVHISGSAYRIRAELLKEACDASSSLRRKLLAYCHTVMLQSAETAHALGRLTIAQRLARWLLLAHDRVGNEHINLTHDFLALMMGARRPGVTDAIAVLEGEGIIKAGRAHIVVRDRDRLIDMAGSSYGRSQTEYLRVIRT